MSKELIKINGVKEIKGKEIKILEGGFGEGQKCLFAKQISEIHSTELKHINELINRNRKRFKDDIDIIDVMGDENFKVVVDDLGLKGSNRTKNIYALSERGYSKLIKIMDTDLAWEIHDELMDNYFTMRKIINSDEQLKAQLLLNIYNGGQEGILASKQLTEIEVKQATKPLLDKIEEDRPLVNFAEQVSSSADSIDMGKFAKLVKDEKIKIGRNKLFEWMRDNKYLMKDNIPYQSKIDQGLFEVVEYTYKTPYGEKIGFKTLVTGKGQLYFVEKLRKEINYDKVA